MSDTEQWADIFEFPGYLVSSFGRILNADTGRHLVPTKQQSGRRMAGLMKSGIQYKRSLPLLVARAFVPSRHSSLEAFDTPIHLDGDQANCRCDNLAWRPLWFARKYMQQINAEQCSYARPIVDVETGEVYENSRHAAMVNGVLDKEVFLSMCNNTYVWPTGQVFRKVV